MTKTIVCIEDDPDIIDLVRLIVKRQGFKLIGALGGREGIETTRRVLPDLVLLDLMMPDVSGWDVLDAMEADKDLEKIPVIVVSVKSNRIDARLDKPSRKVEAYIPKPFASQSLLNSVCTVLGEPC